MVSTPLTFVPETVTVDVKDIHPPTGWLSPFWYAKYPVVTALTLPSCIRIFENETFAGVIYGLPLNAFLPPNWTTFYWKIDVNAFELLYLTIRGLQGFKNKRRCCGYNMLLAFQNGNAKVTRGRQFAKWTKRPFSGNFGKIEKRTIFSRV